MENHYSPYPRKRLRDIEHGYDRLYGSVVSATECTGLTAIIPEDEAEAESYRDIYDIPLAPEIKSRKKPEAPARRHTESSD